MLSNEEEQAHGRPRDRDRQHRRHRGRRATAAHDRADGDRPAWRPASSARARSPTPRRSATRSRSCSPSTSSRKTVRLGVANQRVAVRTLRLPLIEDDDELETAIRFQAQDHIPMPLDQAVLDWQVVATDGAERRAADGRGRRRRPPRHARGAARRDAQSRTAADRDRPLRLRDDPRARRRGVHPSTRQYVDAPARDAPTRSGSAPARSRGDGTGEPAPTPALYCNLGDVTNLAVARGRRACSPGSPVRRRGHRPGLAERRRLTLEHARQWLVHVGLEQPLESDRRRPETIVARPRGARGRRRASSPTSCGSRSSSTAPRRARRRSTGRRLRAGTTIPGLADRLQREPRLSLRGRLARARSAASTREAARLTALLRTRPGGAEPCAPST